MQGLVSVMYSDNVVITFKLWVFGVQNHLVLYFIEPICIFLVQLNIFFYSYIVTMVGTKYSTIL